MNPGVRSISSCGSSFSCARSSSHCVLRRGPQRHAFRSARSLTTTLCTGSGFGKTNKKKVSTNTGVYVATGNKKRRVNIKEELNPTIPPPAKPTTPGSWKNVGNIRMFEADRITKAVLLDNGTALMLYNIDGKVYCSDANSTAYQFPLSDAKIVQQESGLAIEVPFDGTLYDLATGKVLKWCPKDGNMVRGLLHSLKRDHNPVNLKMYEVDVTEGGAIRVKM